MRHEIKGAAMPVLEVFLSQGESIIAEPGQVAWMHRNVSMHTSTQPLVGQRGFRGALSRIFSGGGLFLTRYTALQNEGLVAIATKMPGRIIPMHLNGEHRYIVHRHGFVCGTEGIQIDLYLQRRLGVGLFGGDGFLLQRIGGRGEAFVEMSGEVIEYDLAVGEDLWVHPGHVGVFEERIGFDIECVPGIGNALFGNQGLFFTRLSGPGKVWLQTLTLPGLAHALEPYLPQGN